MAPRGARSGRLVGVDAGRRDQPVRFGAARPRRGASLRPSVDTARSSSSQGAARPGHCPGSALTPPPRRRSCASPRRSPGSCASTTSTSTRSRLERSTRACSTRCSPPVPSGWGRASTNGRSSSSAAAACRCDEGPSWRSSSARPPAMASPASCSAPCGTHGRSCPERRADLDSDVYTLRRIVPRDRGLDWGDA